MERLRRWKFFIVVTVIGLLLGLGLAWIGVVASRGYGA